MIVIIILSLFILGIAFYQALQGLFSAMIMTILTLLAAAIAFNFYEPLAEMFVSYKRLGAYAHGLTLLALFVVPLYVLRILYDRLLKGNVVLGMWADRIGGGVFGLLTAFLLVGMLMLVVQLLPFGGSILGYEPYDSALSPAAGGPPRWAGTFTLGIMKRLSSGSLQRLSGGGEFSQAHDDLQLEAFCDRNRPKGARASTPADALTWPEARWVEVPKGERAAVFSQRDQQAIDRMRDAVPRNPPLLMSYREERGEPKILAARVTVSEDARNAREDDNWWRLSASQFRLVTASGRSFYPLGYLTWSGGRWLLNTEVQEKDKIAKIGEIRLERQWRSSGGPARLTVDWIYKLPADAQPEYIAFRRAAKAPVPPSIMYGLPSPSNKKGDTVALSMRPTKGKVQFTEPARGRFLQPELIEVQSSLPSRMTLQFVESRQFPPEIRELRYAQSKLLKVRLAGSLEKLGRAVAPGEKPRRVREYNEPGTNSMIVQVRCKVNRSFRTDAGTQTRLSSMSPQLMLDNGERISHCGAYFLYDVGGEPYAFFYYDPDRAGGALDLEFAATLAANLSKGDAVGFVFIVRTSGSRRIEGITLSAGPEYEFYPDAPLACTER